MAIFIKPTIALDSSSDTGRSSSDRITNDTSPLFVGNALPNATVRIFSGDILLFQTTSNSSGEYSAQFNGRLPDGLYQITARAVVDGVEGQVSDTLQIRVDTVVPNKPTISLDPASDTGTSSSDRITRDTTPTLIGNAEADKLLIRDYRAPYVVPEKA